MPLVGGCGFLEPVLYVIRVHASLRLLLPPGRVGEELEADLAVLAELVCRLCPAHPLLPLPAPPLLVETKSDVRPDRSVGALALSEFTTLQHGMFFLQNK